VRCALSGIGAGGHGAASDQRGWAGWSPRATPWDMMVAVTRPYEAIATTTNPRLLLVLHIQSTNANMRSEQIATTMRVVLLEISQVLMLSYQQVSS